MTDTKKGEGAKTPSNTKASKQTGGQKAPGPEPAAKGTADAKAQAENHSPGKADDGEDDLMVGYGDPSGKAPSPMTALIAVFIAVMVASVALGLILVLSREMPEEEAPEIVYDVDYDSAGFVGLAFQFDIEIDVEYDEASAEWSFGDGTHGSGLHTDHVFSDAGTYNVTLVLTVDGQRVTRNFLVTVDLPSDGDLLPPLPAPDHRVELSGVPCLPNVSISDMISYETLLDRTNISISGEEHSFVGITLLELMDLGAVRRDADKINVAGSGPYSTTVHREILLPRMGGNETMVVFAADGEWLSDTVFDTPLMLIAPDRTAEGLVKDVTAMTFEPFKVLFTGPGLISESSLSIDDMASIIGPQNYTVNNGKDLFLFTGFPLWGLLEELGALRNTTGIEVAGADGYGLDFDVDDIVDNPESEDPFFLAFASDSELLNREDGPFRLIAPDSDHLEDDGHNWYTQHWIKEVAKVTVKASPEPAPDLPWGSPLPGWLNVTWQGGAVSYTSEELASMWGLMIEANATMVKKTGALVNGTFTGIPVLSLIEEAGAPLYTGNLTFFSADGYDQFVDPMYLYYKEKEEGIITLVALTRDGEWLAEDEGPMRIASSALKSSHWISQLTEIVVGEWEIEFDGEVLTMTDLLSIPSVTAQVDYKGALINYTGVDIVDLGIARADGSIEVFGYDYDEGVVTRSGYSQTIDLSQYAGESAGKRPFLAYKMEGELMSYSDKGPIRMVVPGAASKYWVGSVSAMTTGPLMLTLSSGGVFSNMSFLELNMLGYVLMDQNFTALNSTAGPSNHTLTGIALIDLLSASYDLTSMGNVTVRDVFGMEWKLPLEGLLYENVTAFLVWELDGEGLGVLNGAFGIVFEDLLQGDQYDWTEDDWLSHILWIEVGP